MRAFPVATLVLVASVVTPSPSPSLSAPLGYVVVPLENHRLIVRSVRSTYGMVPRQVPNETFGGYCKDHAELCEANGNINNPPK